MGLDRGLADVQSRGDLAVAESAADLHQHVALTSREYVEPGVRPTRTGDCEPFDEAAGDHGVHQHVASSDGPDRVGQPLPGSVLEEESRRTCSHRLVDVLVEVERGQHEHSCESRVGDQPGGLDAVHGGHADVHHDHVRELPSRDLDGRLAVGSCAHDLDVWLRVEDGCQAVTHHLLIVGHDHACHGTAWGVGRVAQTRKPPLRSGSVVRVPPRKVARSPMPARP